MNVWKIGSRWAEYGEKEYSILDIFIKYNIVFAGKKTGEIKTSVKKGDLIAITDGITVVAIGKVLDLPKPITEFEFTDKDISSGRFDYESWVVAIKVSIYELDPNDYYQYTRRTFNKAHGEHRKKIENIFEKIDKKEKEKIEDIFINFFKKSENRYVLEKNQKTFALKQLKIENYHEIKKIHITNIPTDTQWIFLTGENGYGKTSILQTLVIGLYGDKDEGILLDKKQKIRGGIELKISNENIINNFPPFEFKKFVNFSVYGASRLNKNSKPTNSAKTYSLFNSYADLLDIEDKLIMWEMDKEQRKYFISARKILLQIMSPYVKDIKVERSGSKNRVTYKEIDCEEFKGFSELASGFKSIITMIGDMIIRLSENQSEIINFNELAGIVIIDELDLHLHPKMQRNLVVKLTELFPEIQFIASTHSPIPILGAPKNLMRQASTP